MRLPRFRIGTLMTVVAGSSFAAWGVVVFPRLDHTETSIVLGILLGAASWVVPLIAVYVILLLNSHWHRPPIDPAPPEAASVAEPAGEPTL